MATYYDNLAETCNTTGTGTLTLTDTAVAGSNVFPAAADGDTIIYGINHSNGTDWEVSTGVYTDSSKALTRTLISSSTGSLLSLTGTGHEVAIVVAAAAMQKVNDSREALTAARTYYVRTDGNDSNTGLVDSAGGAFLTVQQAVDVTCSLIDMGPYQVTIQIKDGTYAARVDLGLYVGQLAPIIQGNSGTPSNVLISATSTSALVFQVQTAWQVQDFKLSTTTSGHCLVVASGVLNFSNLDFGDSAGDHIYTYGNATVTVQDDYAISGDAARHLNNSRGSVISSYGKTVTLTGTPNFSSAYSQAFTGAVSFCGGMTFTGSATGKRYDIRTNGVVDTNGAGSTYLPGDVSGTTATGGQYA